MTKATPIKKKHLMGACLQFQRVAPFTFMVRSTADMVLDTAEISQAAGRGRVIGSGLGS